MNELTTVEKLNQFVNQKPRIDPADYGGDSKLYNSTVRDVTKDRNDYYELLSLFLARWGDRANNKLTHLLNHSGSRLVMINGELEYTVGQYFPTEYRKAACKEVATLIWESFRTEKDSHSSKELYAYGYQIRIAISARVSKRVMKLYFN